MVRPAPESTGDPLNWLGLAQWVLRNTAKALRDLVLGGVSFLMDLVSGKSPLDRALYQKSALALSVYLGGRQCPSSVKRLVWARGTFLVGPVKREIVNLSLSGRWNKKRKRPRRTLSSRIDQSLEQSLSAMNIANACIVGVLKKKSTPFDETNEVHVELLKRLWRSLLPNTVVPPIRDGAFGELGFQNGKRPETDLRGMGILALEQLVFFAEKYSSSAREVLLICSNPSHYIPFAATGVNLTAFALDLLESRHLDRFVLPAIEAAGSASFVPPSEIGNLQERVALDVFHRVYSQLFARLGELWEARSPEKGILEFPRIFTAFQAYYKERELSSVLVTDFEDGGRIVPLEN